MVKKEGPSEYFCRDVLFPSAQQSAFLASVFPTFDSILLTIINHTSCQQKFIKSIMSKVAWPPLEKEQPTWGSKFQKIWKVGSVDIYGSVSSARMSRCFSDRYCSLSCDRILLKFICRAIAYERPCVSKW